MSGEETMVADRGAGQAGAGPTSSLASALIAWTAIIFVSPLALYALYRLVPTSVELLERILNYPQAPRLPLTIILLVQVALLTLLAKTFLSWRRDRRGRSPASRRSKTSALGCWTLCVGFLAYLWIALMVAAFPA